MIEPDASKEIFDQLFNTPFCLIDLPAIEDDMIRSHMQQSVRSTALLLTLKHVSDRNLQDFFNKVLLEAFKWLDQAGYRDDLQNLLYYLLNEGEFLNKEQFLMMLHEKFSPETEDKIMTIAQQLRAEGWQEGKQEGKFEIAQRLLNEGAETAFVVKITGLSLPEVQKIHRELLKLK